MFYVAQTLLLALAVNYVTLRSCIVKHSRHIQYIVRMYSSGVHVQSVCIVYIPIYMVGARGLLVCILHYTFRSLTKSTHILRLLCKE